MPNITIRDVPKETHAELAARAALAGQSLQEYLRARLVEVAQRPDLQVLLARIAERKEAVQTSLPADKILDYRNVDRK
jgi:plasmid stability protein